jgi:hypothetical protein
MKAFSIKTLSVKAFSVLIFSLLLCISISVGSRNSRAQTPTPVPLAFPFGGFEITVLDGTDLTKIKDSMTAAGFNTMYHAAGGDTALFHIWQANLASRFPKTMASYYAVSYSGIETVLGSLRYGFRGSEIRNFLATNDTGILAVDLKYRYGGTIGWAVADTVKARTNNTDSRSPIEFYIKGSATGFGGTNQVLNFQEPNAHEFWWEDNWSDPGVKNLPFLYVAPQQNVYCDFIYALDGTETHPLGGPLSGYPDDTLYTLKYTIGFKHGDSRIIPDAITYGKWNTYSDSHEHPWVIHFPAKSTDNSRRYSVLRTILPTTTDLPDTIISVECEVHSFHHAGMYVRGLRMRTPNADSILRGYRDVMLNRYFDTIKARTSRITTAGVTAWSRITALTMCGESTFPSFRVMAYADLLFYKRYGKRLLSFLASNTGNNYAQYRSIYDDQNRLDLKYQTPIIEAESDWIINGKRVSYDPPFMPADAIPAFIRRAGQLNPRDTFTDFGFTMQSGAAGYKKYTDNMQMYYDFAGDDYAQACLSSNAPGHPSSTWHAILSANSIFDDHYAGNRKVPIGTPAHWDTAFTHNVREPVFAQMKIPNLDMFKTGIANYRDCIVPDATTGRVDWFNNTTGVGPDRIGASSRVTFAPEMRADAWDAICHGAKGIFLNPLGSDGAGNTGICDENFRADYDGPSYTTPETNPGLINMSLGSCALPFIADTNDGSTAHWD